MAGPQAFPLSFTQQWIRPEFVDHRFFRVAGPLDVPALREAVARMVARHEPLRTTCTPNAQHVHESMEIPVVEVDTADPIRAATALCRQGFDLGRGPLMRIFLLRTGPDVVFLLMSAHLIVLDGWAAQVWCQDTGAIYRELVAGAPANLPELPIQFVDWAAWHRGRLTEHRTSELTQWWRRWLSGTAALDLPGDGAATGVSGRVHRRLTPGETRGLRDLGRIERSSMHDLLAGAYALTLRRHGGQDRFVLGGVVVHRDRPDVQRLLGSFVDRLAVPIDLTGAVGLVDAARRVGAATAESYAHRELPFSAVSAVLPGRVPSAFFVHRPADLLGTLELAGCECEELPGLAMLPEKAGAPSLAARSAVSRDVELPYQMRTGRCWGFGPTCTLASGRRVLPDQVTSSPVHSRRSRSRFSHMAARRWSSSRPNSSTRPAP